MLMEKSKLLMMIFNINYKNAPQAAEHKHMFGGHHVNYEVHALVNALGKESYVLFSETEYIFLET